MSRRPLVLGAVLVGVGAQGSGDLWRHPDVPTTASIDIDWYIRQAREAEAAHFDFVFVVDSQYIDAGFPNHHLNRLEPLTLLSAVAVATERIGLAPARRARTVPRGLHRHDAPLPPRPAGAREPPHPRPPGARPRRLRVWRPPRTAADAQQAER